MEGVLGPLVFFAFLACLILGPRYLRFKERERMLEMIRVAIERGQTPPPELLESLKFDAYSGYRGGRRRPWVDGGQYYPPGFGPGSGWERGAGQSPQPAPPPQPAAAAQPAPAPEPQPVDAGPSPMPGYGPTPGWTENPDWTMRDESRKAARALRYGPDYDLRRGVILLGVGLGFVAVGLAFYAGLYNVGGATETFATFSALGAIPGFIGLAHIVLWSFARKSTRI